MAFRQRGRKRWLLWAGLAALVVVLVAIAGAALVLTSREGDVNNANVEFRSTETQTTPHSAAQNPPPRGKHPADDGFTWPIWGLDDARTRVLPLDRQFRPPFKIAWRKHMNQLLEFTAVACERSVFILGDDGDLYKVGRWTGSVQWKRKLGTLAAASPACDGKAVYNVLLRRRGSKDGRIVATGADKGHMRWSRRLGGRAESSPLLKDGMVIFGVEDGNVYALDADNGKLVWKFHARGAVKGGLALDRGRLFFGTYGGSVYALRLRDGKQLWRNDVAEGGAFGVGGGNFYSTPAVNYGRVYIGATNGAIYSLSAETGKLAWRKVTNNYVYASPAVGAVAGGPPTVWIGSYNGNFYALDAKDGSVRWQRKLGGKLSGSPTVIGDLVFQSAFDKRFTWALGANTGRTIWSWNRGAFTAAISDGRRIYFNGYGTLYALDPRGFSFSPRPLPKNAPAQKGGQKARQMSPAAKRKARKARAKRRAAARRKVTQHAREVTAHRTEHPAAVAKRITAEKKAAAAKRRAAAKKAAARKKAAAKRNAAARKRAARRRAARAKHRFCRRHPNAQRCR